MNRLAISYAYNCSHVVDGVELIDTYALAFLQAIAYRIPSRERFATEPTTLREMHGLTRMKDRKLRETRDLLVSLGEINEGGHSAPNHRDPDCDRPWAKHAIYELPGLAGSLFIVTPWDVDLNAAQLAAIRARKSAHGAAHSARGAEFSPRNAARGAGSSRHSVPSFGEKAGGVLSSDLIGTSTNNHHSAQQPPLMAAAAQVAAEDLFDWIVEQYQQHNAGALFTLSSARAIPLLIDLLGTGRTLDKLKLMLVKLWTCRADENDWIPTTDRSLYVLREAADTLDFLVSREPAARASSARPARTDIVTQRAEARQRAIGALRRTHPNPAINEARERAADALQAPESDVAAIERELLTVAAANVNAAAIGKAAAAELAPYRGRMQPAAFEESLAKCRERLLREHAMLPDLSGLLPIEEGALA